MSSDSIRSPSNVINYVNGSGGDLVQEYYVIDPVSLQGGTIINKDGIDNGDIGKINIVYTRVVEPLHAQLNADIQDQGLVIDTPVYVADPLVTSAGDIHAIPLAGDLFIGKLYKAQGSDTGIRLQLLPPVVYDDLT